MAWIPAWRRYLRFWRSDLRADLDDELRFHLDMRRDDYLQAGLGHDEADRAARRRFGDETVVRAACATVDRKQDRAERWREWLSSVGQDARYAARQLARTPTFTIAATLTLALGIGANGTLFSLADAALIHPLPAIPDPQRLFELTQPTVSYPVYRDFRDAAASVGGLAVFASRQTALDVANRTEIVSAGVVSGNYFDVLGVRASYGRVLADADDRPNAPPVVVLSDVAWRHFFDQDPAVLGRTVLLNGRAATIIGIAPPRFRGVRLANAPTLWITPHAWYDLAPSEFADNKTIEQRGWSWLAVVMRLRPEATRRQALAVLQTSARQQIRGYPEQARALEGTYQLETAVDASLGAGVRGGVVRFAWVLLAVVAAVLLIACTNVANLMLARAARRRREIGVRLALGAGRIRLLRQLLTETVVLAAMAGGVALLATMSALAALGHVHIPDGIALADLDLHVDPRVIAFTAGVALITGLGTGLLPGLFAARAGVSTVLAEGAGASRPEHMRLRSALLAVQIAVCLVLLIGAGLLTRSLRRALATDVGFDGTRVATATVDLGMVRADTIRAARFYGEVLAELRATPGVEVASWGRTLPLTSDADGETFQVLGYAPAPHEQMVTEVDAVDPGFLEAFAIPLVSGRSFQTSDDSRAQPVAVINAAMAKRFWPGGGALGGRIVIHNDTITVIGVAHDIAYHALRHSAQMFVYLPLRQVMGLEGLWPQTLVVRMACARDGTTCDPASALNLIRRVVAQVDPTVPVSGMSTFTDRAGERVVAQRFGVTLVGGFGALAFIIAMVGVYAVVAFTVTQHTRDIGIRLALGATRSTIVRTVVGGTVLAASVGIALGIALAVLATRALSALLWDVSATDPATFTIAALVLASVAVSAAWIPAHRATTLDLVRTLKAE